MELIKEKVVSGLNNKQIEAVRAIEGPVLILARITKDRTRQKRYCGCSIFAVNMVK